MNFRLGGLHNVRERVADPINVRGDGGRDDQLH